MTDLQNGSDEVDNFLAHYGVKGMKWGVRKDATRSSSSKGDLKKVATSLARAGAVPAAGALGLALPASLGVGIGAKLLMDPEVQSVIADSASSVKDFLSDLGQTTMTKVRSIENPFETTRVNRSSSTQGIADAVRTAEARRFGQNTTAAQVAELLAKGK